ncbi:MAG TPA: TRCF domain-containing protein, partial [Terriglobales bacterium]|nr:TRCF domain-containing protein [Terriglobales bacterium]
TEENQRLRMYKRVAGIESAQQLTEVQGEIQDRYGPAPLAVRNLLEYAALKLLCQRLGVGGIDRKRDLVSIRFAPNAAIDPARLAQFVAASRGAQFSPAGILKFSLKAAASEDILGQLRRIIHDLAGEDIESLAGENQSPASLPG